MKQFLGEYNKNNEPLSSSEMDNLHDNDISTAFVDASGGTRVKQQLQHEPAAETIDMLIEHASDMRASIRVGSLELPLDILQKEKMLFAAGAGISVATGAWILETRPGVLSSALSNITRMLG